jgi:hypothetical protein
MKKQTVRSHYLPQTYLKHFLLENKIEMYKKGESFFKKELSPEQRIHTVIGENALANVGLENNLYNPGVDGLSSDDLEDIFREYGENFYNDLVSVIKGLPMDSEIPDDVKDKLCIFMASMRVRTPQFKTEVEEMDSTLFRHDMSKKFDSMSAEEVVQHVKKEEREDISIDRANKIKASIVNKEYNLEYPNAHFIKIALSSLDMHVDIFRQMTMTIMVSDKRYFITSDNPVVFFVPPDKVNFYNAPRSLTSHFSELFFPITKDIGVTLNWRKGEEKVVFSRRDFVDVFNYNVSHNSFNFIFSPMKMNCLDVFTTEYIPYPFKFTIS